MAQKNETALRTEHEIVRNKVGYYDFTHQTLKVTGPDNEKLLDHIFSNSIGTLKVGKAKYTQMLNEEGIIIDDLIIFRLSDDEFWLSTLYIDQMLEWFGKHVEGFDAEYTEITDQWNMYAVQGPNSRDLINALVAEDVSDLSWFSITDNNVDDIPVKIARAGFTGELGFEIFVHPDSSEKVVERLTTAGKEYDLKEITTDVTLSSLPREKGYVLMDDINDLNLFEADFGWAVDFNTDFIGKEPTQKAKDDGNDRQLLGFIVEETPDEIDITIGDKVLLNDEEVAEVRAITYGFTVEKYIGYVIVDLNKAKISDKVTIGDYNAEITERIFYDKENERLRQ